MKVLVLGVGDAFSALHYSSCLALESDGQWLLIDCPHPIRKILLEGGDAAGVGLDVGGLAGVCLTHLHADHCSGLEGRGKLEGIKELRPGLSGCPAHRRSRHIRGEGCGRGVIDPVDVASGVERRGARRARAG